MRMAVPDYYSENMTLNALPKGWFNAMMGEDPKQIKSSMALKV